MTKYIMGCAMGKRVFRANADTEGPDQPVHLHSLISAFNVNRIIGNYRMYEWRAKGRLILCECAG